ncbi:MAG TPA: ABC transporter permease [Arcobacter sp.]|jgi:phospholipid/cholesterol/gamma-HCH transport system permease protein|nr:ABC transporter permease [Arcobacter sp.]
MFYTIGKNILSFKSLIDVFGAFIVFQIQLFPLFFKNLRFKLIFKEITIIGIGTAGVIILTGFFTGMVMVIQLYSGFHQFGIDAFIGYTVFISIAKELGPVFGALMLISRAVSSMAAELGTMRVTEQIDAIETLALDSKEILVVPKIIATIISLPILVIFFDFIGNISAYTISTYMLGVNPITYQNIIMQNLVYSDIYSGIIKAVIFGYIVSSIGTYMGYIASGGAKGVGIATTKAVVFSAVAVFMFNYLISSVFLMIGW